MTISIHNIDELIEDTWEGKSLNPRFTFGWNDQLISIIDNQEVAYDSVEELIKDTLTDDPTEVQALLMQFEKSPKPLTLAKIFKNYIPIYGWGADAKHAVQSATRNLNKEYKHLMAGQFENPTAYKWTYLNPEYLGIYKVHDPVMHIDIVLLGRDH